VIRPVTSGYFSLFQDLLGNYRLFRIRSCLFRLYQFRSAYAYLVQVVSLGQFNQVMSYFFGLGHVRTGYVRSS